MSPSPTASVLVMAFVVCGAAGVARVMSERPTFPFAGAGEERPRLPSRNEPRRLFVAPARFRGRSRASRRRRAAVAAEIPQLLDLLAAGSSAGLSAPLALRRATDGLSGPLAEEVRATVRAVDLGARWREELEALADRLDLADLRRAVATLTRTETLGSSLSQATAELAASVRQARRTATVERARTAPVKMLFPLVFLVLPAFLLLTVVPVLLTTVQSIG